MTVIEGAKASAMTAYKMGQKVDPRGFRLAINKNWSSVWHDDRRYVDFLKEDVKLKEYIAERLKRAGIHKVQVRRSINEVKIEIVVAKPGLVIGRGGSGIELLTQELGDIVTGKLSVTVVEHKRPNASAPLLAAVVANQIERNFPYRRAMNQAVEKTREAGVDGVRVELAGRLAGVTIARVEKKSAGSIPTSTLKANVDFARTTAYTRRGTIGIKVWIYQKRNKQETKRLVKA